MKRERAILPLIIVLSILIISSMGFKQIQLKEESAQNIQTLSPNVNIPAPPCTPNTIPAIISTSVTLCGTIPITTPSIITANNVAVNCNPGTVLVQTGVTSAFDAIQIAPNVVNAQIIGCTFRGKFLNTIHLMPGSNNNLLRSNIITGSVIGIKEDYGATNNNYILNTISRTRNGMQLEGNRGTARSNTITLNANGIIVGISSASINPTTINAICSSGLTTNQFPPAPMPVICSIPQSGQQYRVLANNINNNEKAVIINAVDNQIASNTLQNNNIGVEVNAIYLGSEINPLMPPQFNVQEYFNAGISINSNTITNNKIKGIQLNGKSSYYWQTSQQYQKRTVIASNTISNNGQTSTQMGSGIVIGKDNYALTPGRFYSWDENTVISSNQIQNNIQDGIAIERGGWVADIIENTIGNNGRNGISIGTIYSTNAQGFIDYPNYGSERFIYHNKINNNGAEGIYKYHGNIYNVILNEINSNGRTGIYVPEDPSGTYTEPMSEIICNDISSNVLEGINYDGKRNTNQPVPFYGTPSVYEVKYNRIMGNGADGIRYHLDSASIGTNFYSRRTYNNHLEGNGFTPNPLYGTFSGYGINADGFYYHGFFANNFVNNNLGNSYDSGGLRVEDEWDERQYELAYDNLVCKNCGGACNYDFDCGWYSGTCVNNICQAPPGSGLSCNPSTGNVDCYANPSLMPWVFQFPHTLNPVYTPRGNYGLSVIVPPSASPPLQPASCTINQQCTTNSCENYPVPVNNQQCGNGNFIFEAAQFTGYYQPGMICPQAYYYPTYQGTLPPSPPYVPPTDPPGTPGENLIESQFINDKWTNNPDEILKDREYINSMKLKENKNN